VAVSVACHWPTECAARRVRLRVLVVVELIAPRCLASSVTLVATRWRSLSGERDGERIQRPRHVRDVGLGWRRLECAARWAFATLHGVNMPWAKEGTILYSLLLGSIITCASADSRANAHW